MNTAAIIPEREKSHMKARIEALSSEELGKIRRDRGWGSVVLLSEPGSAIKFHCLKNTASFLAGLWLIQKTYMFHKPNSFSAQREIPFRSRCS